MTDTSLMLMTGGDFQCEQTNCMGHKERFIQDFRTQKKQRNSHNEQFSFKYK